MSHFCRVSAGLYKDCWSISCFHGPYHELALGAKLLQYVFLSFLSFLHFFASELLARQPIPPWWSAGIWLLLHPPWQPPKSTCFECGSSLQSLHIHPNACKYKQTLYSTLKSGVVPVHSAALCRVALRFTERPIVHICSPRLRGPRHAL